MPSFKDRIIGVLTQDKLITSEELGRALEVQKIKGGRLSDVLVELKLISEDKLRVALSKVFSKPSIDISRYKIDPEVLKILPPNFCRQYQVIPISKFADTLTLAMADPLNILVLDDVKSLTGYKINPIIDDIKRIMRAIEFHYSESSKTEIENLIQGMSQEEIELVTVKEQEAEALSSGDLERMIQEAPVVKFTNAIFKQAVDSKASDILIEPLANNMRIRFRIDGMLKEHASVVKTMYPLTVSRIKVIAGLNIAEHRLPQDGRCKMNLNDHEVDLRISILPSNLGEKVAIRILDRHQINLDITKLGFQQDALNSLKKCVFSPHGMILSCGPTGSGKTTTLYSLLTLVDSPKVNIITVEDPIEFQLRGINQVSIHPEIGLTFASALRSILRQDPNIIMVGEIRDFDTVDIAIKSALTGHLVFSTLHTTTAPGAITRIVNMGIEPFLISSSVICIVGQRLVRILCGYCKEKYELKNEIAVRLKLLRADNIPNIFYRPKGCQYCFNNGYRGRIVLAEVLVITPKIKDLILSRSQEYIIKQCARSQGMQTLREDGLAKARAGLTSLEEVLRVTVPDE